MAGWIVVGVIIGAVAGAVVASIVASRAGRAEGRKLRERAARAESELERQSRSSADQRDLRDRVLSSMEEGVLLLDDDGSRLFSNPAMQQHLGRLPDSIDQLRPLAFREAVLRAIQIGEIQRVEAETSAPSK